MKQTCSRHVNKWSFFSACLGVLLNLTCLSVEKLWGVKASHFFSCSAVENQPPAFSVLISNCIFSPWIHNFILKSTAEAWSLCQIWVVWLYFVTERTNLECVHTADETFKKKIEPKQIINELLHIYFGRCSIKVCSYKSIFEITVMLKREIPNRLMYWSVCNFIKLKAAVCNFYRKLHTENSEVEAWKQQLWGSAASRRRG